MARLNFSVDHDFPADRSAHKATVSKPPNTKTPVKKPAAETSAFDLDNVFGEPSRRPL